MPEREPHGVSVGGRRVAADAGLLGRVARDDLRGNEHVLHAFLADAEPLERAQAVGQRPVDDLSGSVDRARRRTSCAPARRPASLTVPEAERPSALTVTPIGTSLTEVRSLAHSVPVERVAAIARVGPQRVSEAGHGHRHLEQVLARGGEVIEARPQPVARHQRRRFGDVMQGALPAGPSEPNSEGALAGIVGSTKIGSDGKSVSGGGGAPPVPPRPPVPTMTRPPLPLAPAVPGLPPPPMPGFPVPAVPVGDCDDPTFAQANAQSDREDGGAAEECPSKLARVAHYNSRRRRLVKFGKDDNRTRPRFSQPTQQSFIRRAIKQHVACAPIRAC